MELHETRNALAVDLKALELQKLSHASIAFIRMMSAQLVKTKHDLVFQFYGGMRSMGLVVESGPWKSDCLARRSYARGLSR
jgi:hypothetical protein